MQRVLEEVIENAYQEITVSVVHSGSLAGLISCCSDLSSMRRQEVPVQVSHREV